MTYYTMYRGQYQTAPVQLARDLVSGQVQDYRFYRVGQWEYLLVEGDWTLEHGASEFTDVTVYHFYYQQGAPDHEAYWQVYGSEHQDVNINNPYQMQYYSSEKGLPHLREGVSDYAFAFVLLGLICCFSSLFFFITDFLYKRR